MAKQPTGILYLIPSLLSEKGKDTIPSSVLSVIRNTYYFYVENERTTRRFFKLLDKELSIDERTFLPINNHEQPDLEFLKNTLKKGISIGMVSEAGYPCIADPGNILVKAAHEINARVIPLSGPNSMMMALSASGFNGQGFRFCGYLLIEKDKRKKALLALEQKVNQTGESQIFMEAPYRNDQLLEDMIQILNPRTQLCIAADLTAETEFVQTMEITNWKKELPHLHKRPVIFILGK